MSDETTLTTSDKGKKVVTDDNQVIGEVVDIQGNRAHVEPDPNVTDAIMSKLGWGSRTESTFEVGPQQIDAVVQDQIRLKPL
ncbi:hypothetical protein BRC64_11310 [Halobacteriales archaeon QH_10_67_22]|nr:MAG: hypothetical protein BRC64_11310 [Halobacteriales archaeon QH_10_67_22]